MTSKQAPWVHAAKSKRDAIAESIPKEWRIYDVPDTNDTRDVTGSWCHGLLSGEEIEITESDAVDIVEKTSAGIWTSEEVTRAFCHRASIAHQILNCLLETFFDAAIEDARKLDRYYEAYKKPIGPLHGLPVSLKDQFHVKGVETTMGYVGWIGTFQGEKGTGREKVFESEMVKELRDLGAVLFCKTSVPHTLMTGETINNIVGYAWNPTNRNLSAGGSSGGEGALISFRGSPIGFGTDIGGSIRIPAVFNGLFGLRPSSGRLPYQGLANSMDGQNTILSVVGPLSRSVPSLQMVVKAILSQQPWLHDPLVHEIPWRQSYEDDVWGRKLVFGILEHDGVCTPFPPVQRAIAMVAKAVRANGHRTIQWDPPSHRRGNDIGLASWFFDGGGDAHKAFSLSGEPPSPQIAYKGAPDPEVGANKIAATNVAKREYQKEYMEYWNSTADATGSGRPVDAIIMPSAPFPAARPERYRYYGYGTILNVLDYSTCVVPVTKVDKDIDVMERSFKPVDDFDQRVQNDCKPSLCDVFTQANRAYRRS